MKNKMLRGLIAVGAILAPVVAHADAVNFSGSAGTNSVGFTGALLTADVQSYGLVMLGVILLGVSIRWASKLMKAR